MLFDESLKWKCHINMVNNNLSKVIGLLNRLKQVYPQNALLSIYHSSFASHLNYGLLLWGTKKGNDNLTAHQRIMLRINGYISANQRLFSYILD